MSQLDTILARHTEDGCPDSRTFKRELLIELRKTLIVRRGVVLRLRPNRFGWQR